MRTGTRLAAVSRKSLYLYPKRSPWAAGGRHRADRMLENLLGFDTRPLLLTGKILIAYSVLMAFAISGGIGSKAEFDELFDYMSRIARHVVLTVIFLYLLNFLTNDTLAEVAAFYFSKSIGVVYLIAKIGVAAQIAILLKYDALFELEPAWAKLMELEGVRLAVWYFAMSILLNPLFVEAPKELRAQTLWDDIGRDAQNRSLDRKRFPFVSAFTIMSVTFYGVGRGKPQRHDRL